VSQGFDDGGQIAGFVVDDGYVHLRSFRSGAKAPDFLLSECTG
jgi:hypothetical protein